MSTYRHKSGAQKRQEQKQREKEIKKLKKGSLTLFDVGAYRRVCDEEASIESGKALFRMLLLIKKTVLFQQATTSTSQKVNPKALPSL